jgi:hypothetical protein
VDSTGDVGAYSSISIGADNKPVISYYDVTNGDLKVAKCNDAACAGSDETITTVDSGGTNSVGLFSSITVGTDANPVISYFDETAADLKVAKCTDASCTAAPTISAVDSVGNFGSYSSIVIGVDGNPTIAYKSVLGLGSGSLKVAKCNDPACTGGNESLSTVDVSGDAGTFSSIIIGGDGNPTITSFDPTAGDLKLARCNDAACAGGNEANSTLDSAGIVGAYTSITLGADANPVISYYDVTNGDLKLIKLSHTSWTPNGWGR